MNNLLDFIDQTLYELENNYGFSMDLYHLTTMNLNLATGKKNIKKEKFNIKKAIILPTLLQRKYIQTIGGNFDYGGNFDPEDRLFIINRKYIPKTFLLQQDIWYAIYDNKKYEIKKVEEFENRKAVLIVGKHIKGAPLEQIYEARVKSTININPLVSNE